ncbi:amidohydrolase family protein [Falsirhodobacter sp. 1013]|uniref:amidohydrolase family protein n=1 Tax=Falsirhodobacter sp. 1013 TaxID=3417566 RepID=UPI003EBBE0DA
MIIDAHQHFWRIARGDYGWMDDRVAAIRHDRLPADLHPLARAGGIGGTILVQAAPTVNETLFLLEMAQSEPLVRGVVGWIDLEGDVDAQLRQVDHPALRGIRPMLQDIPDTAWVLRDEVVSGLRKIAGRGLRMDVLITPRHLPVIDRLAHLVPELPMVVDHCAKPTFPVTDAWRQGIDALAAHPQVFCKLSGLANEHGPGWSADTLHGVADHVIGAFGGTRVMWGSDWPVLELAGRYGDWLTVAQQLVAPEDHPDVFAETAARFYDI